MLLKNDGFEICYHITNCMGMTQTRERSQGQIVDVVLDD